MIGPDAGGKFWTPQPIKQSQKTDAHGALIEVRIDWYDVEFLKPLVFEIIVVMIITLGSIPFAFATDPHGHLTAAQVIGILILACGTWYLIVESGMFMTPKRYFHRACVFKADGSISFLSHLPDETVPEQVHVGHFASVEYGPTVQWRVIDKRLAGTYTDVYGVLTNGSRFVFSRSVWENEVCHEMRLAFGHAIQEIQDLLKPPAPRRPSPNEIVID